MDYPTQKVFFNSNKKFLRLARSTKQTNSSALYYSYRFVGVGFQSNWMQLDTSVLPIIGRMVAAEKNTTIPFPPVGIVYRRRLRAYPGGGQQRLS